VTDDTLLFSPGEDNGSETSFVVDDVVTVVEG
jgi:hypothetical protein